LRFCFIPSIPKQEDMFGCHVGPKNPSASAVSGARISNSGPSPLHSPCARLPYGQDCSIPTAVLKLASPLAPDTNAGTASYSLVSNTERELYIAINVARGSEARLFVCVYMHYSHPRVPLRSRFLVSPSWFPPSLLSSNVHFPGLW
jgi:hypothetical protein